MKCDADEIDIYSQKDTPLSVPATSLLVAVASVTCQIVFSQFFFPGMPSQDGNWSKEEKMSESLRDNDEATPYGYTVP